MSAMAISQKLPTHADDVVWHYAPSEKSYGLRQGRSQRNSGDIHCGVLVCLPISSGIKATGLAALVALFVESLLSPRFWIVGILLFGVFFAASRGSTILREQGLQWAS